VKFETAGAAIIFQVALPISQKVYDIQPVACQNSQRTIINQRIFTGHIGTEPICGPSDRFSSQMAAAICPSLQFPIPVFI
jgi:hypothetical protein